MAVSVLKAVLLSRCSLPSNLYSERGNMNTFTLVAVFSLGVMFTCIVSILTVYIQKEVGQYEMERKTEDLIADRRKILEKSHKFILIPDESQLSVVDTELAIDPSLYVNSDESPKQEDKHGIQTIFYTSRYTSITTHFSNRFI